MDQHVLQTKRMQVFKNGRSRAVRLPKEFQFEGNEVEMNLRADGTIVMSAVKISSLAEYLKTAEPWNGGEFVSDDSDLLPLDDVEF
jgi:antitoxin VapB